VIYEFRSHDGEVIERDISIHEAPPVGKRIRARGAGGRLKTFRRLPPQIVPAVRRDLHFTSIAIDTWHPDAPRYDEGGRALFASRGEAKEFAAKNADKGEHGYYVWDD
jgi:hypothetical protein